MSAQRFARLLCCPLLAAINKSVCAHRGYNIGTRLIDEFLAKSKTTKCLGFRDAVDKMAKVGAWLTVDPTYCH